MRENKLDIRIGDHVKIVGGLRLWRVLNYNAESRKYKLVDLYDDKHFSRQYGSNLSIVIEREEPETMLKPSSEKKTEKVGNIKI